jgi:hypothetical protein
MDGNEGQFENYLREFEPRRPRALELKRQSAVDSWRRLAAAAGVMIALGTSLWLALHSPARQGFQTVSADKEAVRIRLSIVPLTKLAETDPTQLDAELATASRRVLPDFRGEESTLQVLARK